MTDLRPFAWVLLAFGLLNTTWGAYELGAGGENGFLLVSGLGCLAIWLAVREELAEADAAGAENGGESA